MKIKRSIFYAAVLMTITAILIATLLYFGSQFTVSPAHHYTGGTADIDFEKGTAHSAGSTALISADTFGANGVVTDAQPMDVWAEDDADGYHGFTTRAQLGAVDSIGVLEIESIGLSVHAYDSEDDMADMDKGISHFRNTSYWDGNIGFAGHNGQLAYSFFGNLHKVKQGDRITYQTELGMRSYTVTSIQTIADDDWSYLERTQDNRITLITCTADPTKRLCVQAVEG